jgi:hypothetical protein
MENFIHLALNIIILDKILADFFKKNKKLIKSVKNIFRHL